MHQLLVCVFGKTKDFFIMPKYVLFLVMLPCIVRAVQEQYNESKLSCTKGKLSCLVDGLDSCCDIQIAGDGGLKEPLQDEAKHGNLLNVSLYANRPLANACNQKTCKGTCCTSTGCCSFVDAVCCSDTRCCKNQQVCCPTGCCDTGHICCGNGCCSVLHTCCPGSNLCCRPGFSCCGKSCCPNEGSCCANGRCCPYGSSCCPHGGLCCSYGQKCCGSGCCSVASQCCGEGCCPSGTKCCDGKWCCKSGASCGLKLNSCIGAGVILTPTITMYILIIVSAMAFSFT